MNDATEPVAYLKEWADTDESPLNRRRVDTYPVVDWWMRKAKVTPLYAQPPPPGSGWRDETAWLIEETWSGYVHYVHRDFDAVKWRRECDDVREISKRKQRFITKDVSEAMAFDTKDRAEAWRAAQPLWFTRGDQHQVREHMWPAAPPPPNTGDGLDRAAVRETLYRHWYPDLAERVPLAAITNTDVTAPLDTCAEQILALAVGERTWEVHAEGYKPFAFNTLEEAVEWRDDGFSDARIEIVTRRPVKP